jgi:anaerobic selenocysteine-containing dehydrogenase
MRKGNSTGKRGILVQFEPRLSQTAAAADYWIPILPGTQGLAALGLGRAVAELRGGSLPAVYQNVDLARIAEATGVSQDTFKKMAGLFTAAAHPLSIPGGSALSASNGLEAGQAILNLNVLANNLGVPGGVFTISGLPIQAKSQSQTNTFSDIQALVEAMKSGKVKVLFIHGVNPFFEFPASLGFTEAARQVSTLISFSSFPDETALQADYVFPDHTGLESWGYQKIPTGSDRPVLSGAQPAVVPFYNTKATADVLLAAVQASGGTLAAAVPYKDEVEFLQSSLQGLLQEPGYFNAPDIGSFWAQWQQYGGWWSPKPVLAPTGANPSAQVPAATAPQFDGKGDYYLFPFPSPLLSDGSGANKPWLQETPDPTTTVMWNTWIEIHPDTADKLGLKDDDVVKITSAFGELEGSVYRYPAIHPDTIGIPFGQGHTAFGQYAQERGANLASLLGTRLNGAGDLATSALKVNLTKTGKRRPLARFESVLGVYGNLKP